MKIDTEKKKCLLEDFVAEDLENAIETQDKVTEYSNKHKFHKIGSHPSRSRQQSETIEIF